MLASAVLAGITLLAFPLAASATIVQGVLSGHVQDSRRNVEGTGQELFGLTAEELPGHAVEIEFRYDTSLMPSDADSRPDRGIFGFGPNAWLSASILLNGSRFDIEPNGPMIEVESAWQFGFGGPVFDRVVVRAERIVNDDMRSENRSLTLALSLPVGTATAGQPPTLAGLFPLSGESTNFVSFSMSDHVTNPGTGRLDLVRAVSFGIDAERLELTVIPEPSSAILIGLGLATLARRQGGRGNSSGMARR